MWRRAKKKLYELLKETELDRHKIFSLGVLMLVTAIIRNPKARIYNHRPITTLKKFLKNIF